MNSQKPSKILRPGRLHCATSKRQRGFEASHLGGRLTIELTACILQSNNQYPARGKPRRNRKFPLEGTCLPTAEEQGEHSSSSESSSRTQEITVLRKGFLITETKSGV